MSANHVFPQLLSMTTTNPLNHFVLRPMSIDMELASNIPSSILAKLRSTILWQLGPELTKGQLSKAGQPSGKY